eukprot:CAMPEP_0177665992 /NCGR_PEP_ID=MMETSP0447-20121125/21347_1 /TAXON_ID=0 /ORGANISM="Stygamoeba regulata, Strain BSH-02190019" /LENGTH=489 /DNA_ID=CAMNT_0019172117 /DNA_START=61 /DNA_END=1530 /DNA_ORIENTATION=-
MSDAEDEVLNVETLNGEQEEDPQQQQQQQQQQQPVEEEDESDFTPMPLPTPTTATNSTDTPPPPPSTVSQTTPAAHTATVTHTLPSSVPTATAQMLAGASSSGSLLGGAPTASRIYVGNLGRAITDQLLYSIFACMGPIVECKVIKDRQGQSAGYGFIGYADRATAQKAIDAFHGRWIYDSELRVDWAKGSSGGAAGSSYGGSSYGSSSSAPASLSKYTLFVGDLDPAIQDDTLLQAFSQFGTCTEARVMTDQAGRSRRFGFIGYDQKEHAQLALDTMNGQFLGSKAIRLNWASQRNQATPSPAATDIDIVRRQADQDNTTVYVGNLGLNASDALLRQIYEPYGAIQEVRHQPGKPFGFVVFCEHECAARAICGTTGQQMGGDGPLKVSWGKSSKPKLGGAMGAARGGAAFPNYYGAAPAMSSMYGGAAYGSAMGATSMYGTSAAGYAPSAYGGMVATTQPSASAGSSSRYATGAGHQYAGGPASYRPY